MTRPYRLLVCLLGLGCSTQQPAPTPFPAVSIPFQISSLQAAYLVRGHFWGRVAQDAGGVQVLVDSLYVPAPPTPRASTGTISVRAALASQTPDGRWAIQGFGNTIALRDAAFIGDSLQGPLRFTIPLPRTFDLAVDYLAFEFGFPPPVGSSEIPSTTYACGSPGMLVRATSTVAVDANREAYVDAC